jgi:hypothetical protein
LGTALRNVSVRDGSVRKADPAVPIVRQCLILAQLCCARSADCAVQPDSVYPRRGARSRAKRYQDPAQALDDAQSALEAAITLK